MSLDDKKFYISRDVIFHELVFRFAAQEQYNDRSPLHDLQPATFYDFPPHHVDHIPDISPTSSTPDEHLSILNFGTSHRPVRSHKVPSYLQDMCCAVPL